MNRAYNHPDAVPAEEMNRRDFLKVCAVGALPGLLAACQSGPSKPGVTNLLSPTRLPSPTRQPSPTGADWTELASSLQGTLVRSNSPYYPTARQLFNPRFDSVQPAGIAYCTSPADVQTCLAFARRFGLPLVPHSGGHSYAGYSTTTGLVLDVTRMRGVTVDAGTRTAIVGAGTRLIDVYAALAQHGLALPAGTPTLQIGNLVLSPGIMMVSGCGSIPRASRHHHSTSSYNLPLAQISLLSRQ